MIHATGDDAVDQLLSDDPLALLIAVVLDQQVRNLECPVRDGTRPKSISIGAHFPKQ